MKNKIKPFIKRLIKDNIYYIVGNVFIIILIIITIRNGITEIDNYETRIASLKMENAESAKKVTLINSTIPKSDKLDEDVKFLNNLIPDTEDYFTIVYALEKLSQNSNFMIIDYTVNVKASTPEELKIKVTGVGDNQSLIKFLKDINFLGGRLITSNKVQLDPNFTGSIVIDLTFYNKKVKTTNKLEVSANSKTYKQLEDIKAKVNFNFDDNEATASPSLDYPKKNNPF
jgi:Tfp pilus assembly protein PilO